MPGAARESGNRGLQRGVGFVTIQAAIISFPGSNCDSDAQRAVVQVGMKAAMIWHRETDLGGADLVIIPGGFSYGDYLRAGAIAKFSPVMGAVRRFAASGGPVLGICNGFQILCEAELLPGSLLHNAGSNFVSRTVGLRICLQQTPFTRAFVEQQLVRWPIAHGEGRYVASADDLRLLEEQNQIVLRYAADGPMDAPYNPNGSTNDIAGICNREGNVVGIMPHPERDRSPLATPGAGLRVFQSVLTAVPATGSQTSTLTRTAP